VQLALLVSRGRVRMELLVLRGHLVCCGRKMAAQEVQAGTVAVALDWAGFQAEPEVTAVEHRAAQAETVGAVERAATPSAAKEVLVDLEATDITI
jgi:hypothetical protein